MADFNSKIIEEFRASGGTVGGRFAGSDILLLHHTGARSGTERVSPLAYQRVGESFAVFASKAGGPQNPAWYHNLLAHPETTIEAGTETIKVKARVAEYEEKAAPRRIPVVVLEVVK
jgi:deazaflavin-dependent oxidoreductase (nitroreductase family)